MRIIQFLIFKMIVEIVLADKGFEAIRDITDLLEKMHWNMRSRLDPPLE